MIGHIKNIVLISYFVMVSTSIKNIIDFTNYTTAATAFYHPIADSSINNKDNVTLRSSSSLSSTTTTNTSSSLLSSSSLRDLTPMNQDQPIPAAFVYTKELYNTKQNNFRHNTNSSIIVMNPKVYGQLTNRIYRIKQARKPLLIMINSHPCAGKTFFIHNHTKNFRGCTLVDHDRINHRKYQGRSLTVRT